MRTIETKLRIVQETLQPGVSVAEVVPEGLQKGLVDADGNVNENLLRELDAWQAPAVAISREYGSSAASLGIPTWHYGFEPPTPFASHVGNYFQNSVREDGLVSVARGGIIFAPGAAGRIAAGG